MSWQDQLHGDSLSWLLEKDTPGERAGAYPRQAGRSGALEYDYTGKT